MAANTLPIPEPPRTPSPLDEDKHDEPRGLGLQPAFTTTAYNYDVQDATTDPLTNGLETGRTDSSASTMLSPSFSSTGGLSPNGSLNTPITPQTASTDGGFPAQEARNPFNFTTMQYDSRGNRSGSLGKSSDLVGKRRGHKYRHSSIHASAMDSIFSPPALRTPLAVPSSLPIPTWKEARKSLTSNQRSRLLWCACHFLIAGYVQFSGSGSLAMTALSRLLLFDAAGATCCVIVDVMGNFEVWKRSSIKHPFGLERADVLAGFGMAVFITFMGLDIISHGIEHSLENVGSHEPHVEHPHDRVPAGSIDIASLLAILSTLISAIVLKNHKRIGKATNLNFLAGVSRVSRVLGNPSHVLTLSTSVLLLILPLLSIKTYTLFDLAFSWLIAGLMITLGFRLGISLASMLLMSYKPSRTGAVRDLIADVEVEPGVSAVEEARFWQVHYGLCMANLKLRYRGGKGAGAGAGAGYGDEMMCIRQKVASLVRQRLGGKWEVSLQMAVERD